MRIIAGKPVSWIFLAPSVTPRKTSIGSNNPAMRLYKFDTDTGQVSIYIYIFISNTHTQRNNDNYSRHLFSF